MIVVAIVVVAIMAAIVIVVENGIRGTLTIDQKCYRNYRAQYGHITGYEAGARKYGARCRHNMGRDERRLSANL